MKSKISIMLIIIISALLFNNTEAQYFLDGNWCGTETGPVENISSPFVGLYKPIRTDLSGINPSPGNAYFPVLVVYVQYKDDYDYPEWPQNQAPIYLDSMIATEKITNSNWWDAYNEETEIISDYW